MNAPDSNHFAIAIDGPAASGKSTVARLLAQRLGLVMVNSGAMYRAVTWKALSEHIDPHDSAAVANLLHRIHIECGHDGISSTITIDGFDPGDALRSEMVNANVSAISAIPEVRAALIGLQRGFTQHSNVVMEGRDIGSVVFPDTPYKIYIDAASSRNNNEFTLVFWRYSFSTARVRPPRSSSHPVPSASTHPTSPSMPRWMPPSKSSGTKGSRREPRPRHLHPFERASFLKIFQLRSLAKFPL
ncbi:MAG: (d)CMP kinase [Verrucomicrobia bacterium]|nr:(d)CMP kinase [Verrucomicrobiota bacterium]